MASSTESFMEPMFPWTTLTATGFTGFAVDASGKKAGFVFRVPKTGNLNKVAIRQGALVTAVTTRCGLFTVDSSGLPTTTPVSGGAYATYTPTANSGATITFPTAYPVTAGQILAVVFEPDSTVGNNTYNRTSQMISLPYMVTCTGGVWSKFGTGSTLRVGYDDNSWPNMLGSIPTQSLASVTYNNASATDEYGNLWVPDAPARVIGAHFFCQMNTTVLDVVLYQGSTAIATATYSYLHSFSTAGGVHSVTFTSPVTVVPGTTYRLTLRPSTSGNVQFWSGETAAGAALETWFGQSYYSTSRADLGAWTDSTLAVYWIAPVLDKMEDGTGPDISGANIISGTVTQNGAPVNGATVRLIRQSDNGVKTTTTNVNGQYTFSVAAGYLYHAIAEWTSGGASFNAKSLFDLTPV